MMQKESQQIMMQHSEVKIRLLKLYLERYLTILSMSRYFGDIYIYDLFCGEGIYENGGKGSPIIILETIKSIYFASKAKGNDKDKFNCLFNDNDADKIEKLKKEIPNRHLHYLEMGRLDIRQMDYKLLLPLVNKEINAFKKEKAFIFIDPYGYKDIKVSDIINLLSSKKSEVLLFLPTQFMFRFETKGTPVCLVDFISELMPQEEWPTSNTGINFIETLTEAFRKRLGPDYFTDSFIITRELNQFFCLFFFTSHIYGFDRMLDAKWEIDAEEGRGWCYQTGDSLFDDGCKVANTRKLENKLLETLSKGECTNGELYRLTLQNGHLPCHTNEILTNLQKEGRLLVTKADGTMARKAAFYLSYKLYKEEPDKIKVRLK
jgi:three-Cys-motif partner protein